MSQSDLDELQTLLLSSAQRMLRNEGAFSPFGAAIHTDGRIESLAVDAGGDKRPEEKVIGLTVAMARDAATGKLRAAGTCMDEHPVAAGNTQRTDRIRAHLEHRGGTAIEVCLRYRKGLFGRIKYDDLLVHESAPVIFRRDQAVEDNPSATYKRVALHPEGPLIVISYAGTYPAGAAGNEFGSRMADATRSVIAEVHPAAVVLDFTNLAYEWGDAIGSLAIALARSDKTFVPAAIVATGPTARAIEPLLTRPFLLGVAGVQMTGTIDEAIANLTPRIR